MYRVAPMSLSRIFQSCIVFIFLRIAAVSVSTQSTSNMFHANLWHVVMLSSFLWCNGTCYKRPVVFYINIEASGIFPFMYITSVAAVIGCASF